MGALSYSWRQCFLQFHSLHQKSPISQPPQVFQNELLLMAPVISVPPSQGAVKPSGAGQALVLCCGEHQMPQNVQQLLCSHQPAPNAWITKLLLISCELKWNSICKHHTLFLLRALNVFLFCSYRHTARIGQCPLPHTATRGFCTDIC